MTVSTAYMSLAILSSSKMSKDKKGTISLEIPGFGNYAEHSVRVTSENHLCSIFVNPENGKRIMLDADQVKQQSLMTGLG